MKTVLVTCATALLMAVRVRVASLLLAAKSRVSVKTVSAEPTVARVLVVSNSHETRHRC